MSTVLARFEAKVDRSGTCHLWTAADNGHGYGVFRDEHGRLVGAHVWAWERVNGPVPPDKVLDHVRARGCISTLCVLVTHLEPVPHRENTMRGDGPTAQHARKDRYPKCGGPYTAIRGGRRCRPCDVKGNRARRERNRP